MHARFALMLATDQHWEQRIHWIRGEFGVGGTTSVSGSSGSGRTAVL
jgi:hypothetical protein